MRIIALGTLKTFLRRNPAFADARDPLLDGVRPSAGKQLEQLIADVGMGVNDGAKNAGRHAGKGYVGDRKDSR